MDTDDDLSQGFDCPRCGISTEGRFYGPCVMCRQALVATLVGPGGSGVAPRFEPAMHVIPGQVATKE